MRYYYCVNTFNVNDNPVQRDGFVDAASEEDAIKRLIEDGVVCATSYEFLELYVTIQN